LWRRAESVPLHAATFAAVAVSIGAAADHLEALHDQAAPLGIWLLAISWLWAARAGTIAPRQFGCLLGAVVAIVAAQSTQQVRWGLALAVVTAAALVALAVRERNLPLLGVGAFGTFLSVPPVMQRMFPGSVGAAVGLLIAGALMLLCAIAVLRRDPVLGGMTWSGELDAAFGDPTTDSNRARRFPIGRLPATTTGPPSPGEALRLENRRQTHDISNLANASSGHNAHAGVAAVDLWSERLAQPANAPHTAGDVTEATSACSCRFTRTRRADPTGGGPIPVAVGDALVLESIEYRAPG